MDKYLTLCLVSILEFLLFCIPIWSFFSLGKNIFNKAATLFAENITCIYELYYPIYSEKNVKGGLQNNQTKGEMLKITNSLLCNEYIFVGCIWYVIGDTIFEAESFICSFYNQKIYIFGCRLVRLI